MNDEKTLKEILLQLHPDSIQCLRCKRYFLYSINRKTQLYVDNHALKSYKKICFGCLYYPRLDKLNIVRRERLESIYMSCYLIKVFQANNGLYYLKYILRNEPTKKPE